MRRLLFAAGVLILMPLGARAECIYVRTSYTNASCKALPPDQNSPSEPVSSTTTLPGLEEAPVGPMDQVTCDCEYVLQGANPLCDGDRAQEFSQTYPHDASLPVCRRAKSLCASVCPRQLP